MTKELKELSNQLISEIQKITENIEYLTENQNKNFDEFEDDENDSNEKKLQKQETWYDQMYEKYEKADKLVESEKLFHCLFVEFQ